MVYKIRQTFAMNCPNLNEILCFLKWRSEKVTIITKFGFQILDFGSQKSTVLKMIFFFRVCTMYWRRTCIIDIFLITFDNFRSPIFVGSILFQLKQVSRFPLKHVTFRPKMYLISDNLKGSSRTLVMLFYNSKYVFISEMALANFSVSY
jgi:hypothetical protein